MAYSVFHAGHVSCLLKPLYAFLNLASVLFQYGRRNQIKPVVHQFLQGTVTQYFKSRPVRAYNPLPVQRMTHHPAVYGGENRLKALVLAQNLLLILAL